MFVENIAGSVLRRSANEAITYAFPVSGHTFNK